MTGTKLTQTETLREVEKLNKQLTEAVQAIDEATRRLAISLETLRELQRPLQMDTFPPPMPPHLWSGETMVASTLVRARNGDLLQSLATLEEGIDEQARQAGRDFARDIDTKILRGDAT